VGWGSIHLYHDQHFRFEYPCSFFFLRTFQREGAIARKYRTKDHTSFYAYSDVLRSLFFILFWPSPFFSQVKPSRLEEGSARFRILPSRRFLTFFLRYLFLHGSLKESAMPLLYLPDLTDSAYFPSGFQSHAFPLQTKIPPSNCVFPDQQSGAFDFSDAMLFFVFSRFSF